MVQLTKGSPRPGPVPAGKVRLYSNHICPYAQRIRIVLLAKNIPHEIVDIDLANKPEWYTEVNPASKVPALEVDDKVVVESLDIAEFLDQKYPNPPLQSSDPSRRAEDKKLIDDFGKVTALTAPAYQSVEGLKPLQAAVKQYLAEASAVLKKRGTKFFNGSSPGIVEYMLWPFLERIKAPFLFHGVEFKPEEEGELYKLITAWRTAIKEDKAIKETLTNLDEYVAALKRRFAK